MTKRSVIEQILEQLGLLDECWTELDTIDAGCAFIVENQELLSTLPARVRGDLSFLTSDVALYRRKSVCALARRMAKEIQGAIIARRKQVWRNGKTISRYSYKLIK